MAIHLFWHFIVLHGGEPDTYVLVNMRCSPVPAFLLTPTPRCGLRITDVKLLFFIPTPPGLGRTERSFPFPYTKRFSFTVRQLLAPIFKVAGFLLHYAILGIFIAPFILCIALTDALRILKSGAPALGSDLICAICNRFNDARSHAGGLSAEFPHNSRRGTYLFGAGRDTHRLVMLTGLEPILRD